MKSLPHLEGDREDQIAVSKLIIFSEVDLDVLVAYKTKLLHPKCQ